MLVEGTLKCLHCSYISGRWIGQGGAPLTVRGFRAGPMGGAPKVDGNGLVRCGRCEGPVFLDEAGLVNSATRQRRIRRLREQIAALQDVASKDRAA